MLRCGKPKKAKCAYHVLVELVKWAKFGCFLGAEFAFLRDEIGYATDKVGKGVVNLIIAVWCAGKAYDAKKVNNCTKIELKKGVVCGIVIID